jgi:hypothetical protein
MIFWNMKYLFYNCQLLLLCWACCKFAIQAFMHEDRHTIQPALAKNCQFYRRVYRRTYTRQYFTESCKQKYGLLPQLPTAVYPSVFHKELQTKLRPFATITDGRIPVDISQRVANKVAFFHNYRRVYRRTYTRQYFTKSCKTITAFCHNYRRVYRRTCHNYQCIYRRFLQQMAHNPKRMPVRIDRRFCRRTRKKQCTHVLAHNFRQISRRISKNIEGFLKFLLENQLNTDGNYRRNLMPPPKKLLLYVPSAIPSEILCYKTLPPPLLDSFLLGSSFHLLFSSPCVLSFCKSFYCCVGSFQHIKRYVFFFLYLCIVCFLF